MIAQGQRVYHRRADAFAVVEQVAAETALVKYEWPFASSYPAQMVPLVELVPAAEVEHGR